MARNNPPVDVNLATDVGSRLDEIAVQLQSVAAALRDALDKVAKGEITAEHLDSFRSAADTPPLGHTPRPDGAMEGFRLLEVLYDSCAGHRIEGSRGSGRSLVQLLRKPYSKSHS